MLSVGCLEKEILQHNCAAAWDAYADAARESGLSIDQQGHLRPPSFPGRLRFLAVLKLENKIHCFWNARCF